MRPISQNAIGRELGLSSSAMTKMRKAGCPMDSVESVRAWRIEHLNIAKRKPERRPAAVQPAQHLERAQAAMQYAATILDSGQSLGLFEPALREALRCVPPALRDQVGLDGGVMRELLAPFLRMLDKDDLRDIEIYTDAQAHEAGVLLYGIACGEVPLKEARHE